MLSVLDSAFEFALRVIMLLTVTKRAYTADKLALLDAMTIYAKKYGLAERSLHGHTAYVLDEFDAKCENITESLRLLVLYGLVDVSVGKDGFRYSAAEAASSFSAGLDSEYADNYIRTARIVADFAKGKTENELFNIMSQRARLENGN